MRTPHSLRLWGGKRCLSALFSAPLAVRSHRASDFTAPIPNPGDQTMAEPADEESPRATQKRVQPFLDCIAYLLAKRWLRDQREQPAQPQKRPADGDESSAP